MAFYGLVFCAMLTKKITLRHLAFGLTIYSAVFNAITMIVLSCTTYPDLPYLVILMFRVPAAAFLLTHGCFFALGIWLFISANRQLTALERLAVAVTIDTTGHVTAHADGAADTPLSRCLDRALRQTAVSPPPRPLSFVHTFKLRATPLQP